MEQVMETPVASLEERIAVLVQKADEITAEYWKRMNFTYAAPNTHRADYISPKWCRIVTVENWPDKPPRDSSVYAFVCLQDGYTKALGALKAGDVHKPAGWKAPAKHARGNVFNDNHREYLTSHGPVYLK